MTFRDRNPKLGATGTTQAATVNAGSWYELINQGSGRALDISGASTAEGTAVRQWTRNGGAHQRFQFVDSGEGYYNGSNQQFRLEDAADGYVRLINGNSGKGVEGRNAATTDGAKVVQFTDRGGANQRWNWSP